jgi:hypothetical protein
VPDAARRYRPVKGRTHARQLPLFVALVFVLALVPAAFAAKGGGGGKGGGGKTSGGTGSFSLALLNGATAPTYGGQVTFNVTSTVTYPWVNLACYQNGTLVSSQYVGYYAGYPWSQVFGLWSSMWTGGAADCNARLYDSSTNATLATLSFHVDG